MTKKVYARARYVPARSRDRFTPDRIYEVAREVDDGAFLVRDDTGVERYCLWRGCAYLDDKDWKRIEVDPKALDPDKPVRTRDGREVRILCWDRDHPTYPIVGLVRTPNGGPELSATWRADGVCSTSDAFNRVDDLVPYRRTVRVHGWLNVYPLDNIAGRGRILHATRDNADAIAAQNRIACVEVDLEVEEGEGL